ncbi:hypothetical protein ACP3V9_25220, partial [Salmonella enterica]|uniref:hypothetical protein n=1 Tax=Salmonella enterica TaxID=28901 RepID=UPI003CF8CB2F
CLSPGNYLYDLVILMAAGRGESPMEEGKNRATHHLSYQCWHIDKMPEGILSTAVTEHCRITGFSIGKETIECLHGNEA